MAHKPNYNCWGPQIDEIWQTLLDLDVVDQVAVGARIDAAAELGDLPLALDLVAYIKKNRPPGATAGGAALLW